MSNMSYCMFENTERDFKDCLDKLQEVENLNDFSDTEKIGAKDIYEISKDYIIEYEKLKGC